MPPRSKTPSGHRLFIFQHMKAQDLTYEALADRIGVAKNTVWRWVSEPHRLDPEKLERLAGALGLDSPAELWFPPGRQRVDPLLADVPPDKIKDVVDFVKRFVLPKGA